MRVGWEQRALGDVCVIERRQGIHPDQPYVGLEHIESGTGRITNGVERLSVKSSTFKFGPEHLLYGRLRPYLNKVALPDFEGHCSTEIFPVKPKEGVLREFLHYWFLMQDTVDAINSTCTGARMPRADLDAVLKFVVYIPAVSEQRRIVSILDEAFDGIATAKANAEKNLQNAYAVLEAKLQSIVLEQGAEWRHRTLKEIAAHFGRGRSKHRPRNAPHLYSGKYPFIQTGDIRKADHIITEYSQTYSEAGLAQSKLWPKGTICITIAANIAETAILGFDACFPDSVIGVVANPKEAEAEFVEYLLQAFRVHLQAMGKGSAQDNINMGTFESQRFPVPPVSEQRVIVKTLKSLQEKTQNLESIYRRKLAALDELKQSLLNQAFSGAL